jgi:hypothetical protein
MAYNFLELVNRVNRRLNEVELNSTNFPTATGFYAHAKDAINQSIRDINQSVFTWPWNHTTQTDTMVAGTSRIALQTNYKYVDRYSFRIKQNDTLGNDTQRLVYMEYHEYLNTYIDQEYETDTSIRGLPLYVTLTPSEEYVISPPPDLAYEVTYEYYSSPASLALYSDTPIIPEKFSHVIDDRAMYYAYLFRSNKESADMMKERFDDNLEDMRKILLNNYDRVRGTERLKSAYSGVGRNKGW